MTEETKKRLPDIIRRIDELQDEVANIYSEEFEDMKRDTLDEFGRVIASNRLIRLNGAYASLDDASRLLRTFRRSL